MKKLILIALVLIAAKSHAQNDWISQNSGISGNLQDVYFTDANTGWCVGDVKILNTSNGGSNWNAQTSTAFNTLKGVFFIDESIGWVVGYGGQIFNTTDGGSNWNYQTGAFFPRESVFF